MGLMPDDGDAAGTDAGEPSVTAAATGPALAPTVNLTRLRPVPVAQVWPTEAQHFTPWLLANAALLGEILGVDLELDTREYRVGKFSLDIIGRDLSTGAPVIIENQFGPTDHSHLGQILTYAGGTKPSTIVWVAEQFRDEHRAALEWLNVHTDPSIRFFGVRLSAVTLDGAPPGLIAPFLELIVEPNEWEKQAAVATAAATTATTPTQELYREFWSELEPHLKQRGWTNASAQPQNWWYMPAGVGGVFWALSYATFGCRSELYFQHPDPAVNLARLQDLLRRRTDLERAFGGDLIFDELPGKKACRLETRLNGPKITERDRWPEVIGWMLDTQARLRHGVATVGGVPATVPPPEDITDA
jgi:Domain of unknown function (DUF4268)